MVIYIQPVVKVTDYNLNVLNFISMPVSMYMVPNIHI